MTTSAHMHMHLQLDRVFGFWSAKCKEEKSLDEAPGDRLLKTFINIQLRAHMQARVTTAQRGAVSSMGAMGKQGTVAHFSSIQGSNLAGWQAGFKDRHGRDSNPTIQGNVLAPRYPGLAGGWTELQEFILLSVGGYWAPRGGYALMRSCFSVTEQLVGGRQMRD